MPWTGPAHGRDLCKLGIRQGFGKRHFTYYHTLAGKVKSRRLTLAIKHRAPQRKIRRSQGEKLPPAIAIANIALVDYINIVKPDPSGEKREGFQTIWGRIFFLGPTRAYAIGCGMYAQ